MKQNRKKEKALLIFQLILISTLLGIWLYEIYNDITVICILLGLAFVAAIIAIEIGIPLLKNCYTEPENENTRESKEESMQYVKEYISGKDFVEVIPIKDEPEKEHFRTKELTKRCKFYGMEMKDKNILIVIQFNKEEEGVFFEKVKSENFKSWFRVV